MHKALQRDHLRGIQEVLSHCLPHINVFVYAKTAHFRNNIALTERLSHIHGKLVHDLERGYAINLFIIMRQLQGQIHDVVILFLLHMLSDVCQDLDGLVSDGLEVIIEKQI